TFIATWRPASASIRARAKSMPVVTPAEDHTLPSCTTIASGSTATCGCRVAAAAYIQWVAARRPSSTPAAASRKLPAHTEHTRRHEGDLSRTHRTRAWSRVTSSNAKAPGTINVSIGSRRSDRTDSVMSSTPLAVFTGPPRIETTEHSYVTRLSRDPP